MESESESVEERSSEEEEASEEEEEDADDEDAWLKLSRAGLLVLEVLVVGPLVRGRLRGLGVPCPLGARWRRLRGVLPHRRAVSSMGKSGPVSSRPMRAVVMESQVMRVRDEETMRERKLMDLSASALDGHVSRVRAARLRMLGVGLPVWSSCHHCLHPSSEDRVARAWGGRRKNCSLMAGKVRLMSSSGGSAVPHWRLMARRCWCSSGVVSGLFQLRGSVTERAV